MQTDTPPSILPATSTITFAHRWDHFWARVGVNRMGHRVAPGLYALGSPTPAAPVLVTGNYTLSFDALRAALPGHNAYLLVLDTLGVNVWCAAGEGTFGTEELVRRIGVTGLAQVVTHRGLILPQLGAPGVAAHEVKRRTGFKVEYGPVTAKDLPQYLQTRQATPEMRRVRFPLADRLAVAVVDMVKGALPTLLAAALAFLLGGPMMAGAALAAGIAGLVLFPMLLPWLPTEEFSRKGFFLGGLMAMPFALAAWQLNPEAAGWLRASQALAYLLALPPVVAYLALMFTGSTTFTSRTGVRREIFAYIPAMAVMFGMGVALALGVRLAQGWGGLG